MLSNTIKIIQIISVIITGINITIISVLISVISTTSTSTSSANANANASRTGIGYSQSKNNNDYKNNSNDSNDSNNSNNNDDNDDDDDDYKYFISPSSCSTPSQQNNQKASRMNMRPLSLSLLLPNSILSPILEIRTAPISPIFSPISVSDAVNLNETSVNLDEVKDGEGERNGREEIENGENNGNKRNENADDPKYKNNKLIVSFVKINYIELLLLNITLICLFAHSLPKKIN